MLTMQFSHKLLVAVHALFPVWPLHIDMWEAGLFIIFDRKVLQNKATTQWIFKIKLPIYMYV